MFSRRRLSAGITYPLKSQIAFRIVAILSEGSKPIGANRRSRDYLIRAQIGRERTSYSSGTAPSRFDVKIAVWQRHKGNRGATFSFRLALVRCKCEQRLLATAPSPAELRAPLRRIKVFLKE